MAVESPGFANQAGTYAAEQTRRAVFFPFATQGIKNPITGYAVSAGSGMAVDIAAGEAIVQGTSTSTQGFYYVLNSAAISNLAVAAANISNPRIDAIVLTITDSQYVGATDTAVVQVLTGTPTSGANLSNLSGAPSLPVSTLLLAYLLVPAGATSLNSGDIANQQTTPWPVVDQSGSLAEHDVAPGGSQSTANLVIPMAGLWLIVPSINVVNTSGAGTASGNIQLQQNSTTVKAWSVRLTAAAGGGDNQNFGSPWPLRCATNDDITLQYNTLGGSAETLKFAYTAPNSFSTFAAFWLHS